MAQHPSFEVTLSLDLTLYRDATGFAALRREWNPLLSRSRSDHLFLTWEWQSIWWRCLGEGELYLLAWRDGETLVGIAPLYLVTGADGRRTFHLVGCVEVSDYLDVLVAAQDEERVYTALLAWLTGGDAPAWDVVSLCNLPQSSMTHRLLPELAAAAGLSCLVSVEDVCPVIELPDSWEAYLEQRLNKKQRHEVRRKLNKIAREASPRWVLVGRDADLDAEISSFIALHRQSTPAKRSFMTPTMEAFFVEMAHALHRAGWLHLSFLEINGDRAAAMLAFRYGDRLLIYNSGYRPEAYADLSPGIVLTSYLIQDAIAQGLRVFDFLQGDEVYKYRFGAVDTLVYRTEVFRAP
ncbi:MAG: GNAT family N-acetyltransferase [Caldilineales bacterium]|nr:GNAT family N-acetyltransferase [Caldilineales bacterium]